MSNKDNYWRVFLHGFGVHFWGEWSQSFQAVAGKLRYTRYRFCQICGLAQHKMSEGEL